MKIVSVSGALDPAMKFLIVLTRAGFIHCAMAARSSVCATFNSGMAYVWSSRNSVMLTGIGFFDSTAMNRGGLLSITSTCVYTRSSRSLMPCSIVT